MTAARAGVAGATAIVTGGGSGIGAALSRVLAAGGADVVVADIDLEAARAVTDPLAGARAVRLDFTYALAVAAPTWLTRHL